MLRLDAEPQPLVALASARDALGLRATRILEHVEWPGKPGASAAAAALTPEEQQWFTAGEQVYKNLCQACHQADGRGQERMGANLVGSSLALGSPQVAARVVLNGKEGKIGLMPPLGGALSDDQIAGALTFVRRQWGNDASAVPPSLVKSVRAQTADRTRPWTDDELANVK
jgi:mono/diheme cytochrome c family protein